MNLNLLMKNGRKRKKIVFLKLTKQEKQKMLETLKVFIQENPIKREGNEKKG